MKLYDGEIVIDTETIGVDPLDGHRARLDLKVYLRRRIDAFINPLVYSFRTIKHTDHHDHVGGAGGRVSGSADV